MEDLLNRDNLPKHIAVIMDGNGRWAKGKGAARIFGHRNAIKAVREVTEGCAELGISYLTLYAFSTENWNRPEDEVKSLMSLLVSTIIEELPTLMKNNVSLQTIGDVGKLPLKAQKQLEEGKSKTKQNTGLKLVLALNYSGKWDITNAVNTLLSETRDDKSMINNGITQSMIEKHLSTSFMPDPELLIRTSGEMRISNFLLWQLAYTEMYFTPVLWPDFRRADLLSALTAYQKRERRFGLISEQVNPAT